MYTPLIYTKGIIGPLRAQNLYYWGMLILAAFLSAYLPIAFRTRKRSVPDPSREYLSVGKMLLLFGIMGALLLSTALQRGTAKTWGTAAYQDLKNGWKRDQYRLYLAYGPEYDRDLAAIPNIAEGN